MIQLKFVGQVEQGEGMAARLGCPTANIRVEQGVIIPGLGVYLAESELCGNRYPSLVCINDGRDGHMLKMEVHLLGFSGNLAGETLAVLLLKKLRDLVPWQGEEDMKEHIIEDLRAAKDWFRMEQQPQDGD